MWRRGGWLALVGLLALCGCASGKVPFAAPPQATPTATPLPRQSTTTACPATPTALDNRTSATAFVLSYYNAISRQDLLRAYGYLFPLNPLPTPVPPAPTATPVPIVSQWQMGYTHTACVLVTYTGAELRVTSATAGYAGVGTAVVVPISFAAVGDTGTLQQFTGTYAVRFDPAQGLPASGFLALDFAHITQVG